MYCKCILLFSLLYIVIYSMIYLAQMASESLVRLQYCYSMINFLTSNTPATNKQSIIYGKGFQLARVITTVITEA